MDLIDIVGIRLISTNEIKYYNANGISLRLGDYCVVPTPAGDRLSIVIFEKTIDEKAALEFSRDKTLKNVIRKGNTKDMCNNKKNLEDAGKALKTCREKVQEREMNMKILSAWYNLNRSRLTFYFSAEGRIDFRELVKDLAHIFKTRIELYQIGVRDEAKKIGGIGICGKEVCCKSFLQNFAPITIKMAKMQCLNLAPHKVSGICGRLFCCLDYENGFYCKQIKLFPHRGTKVSYKNADAAVIGFNLIKNTVALKFHSGSTFEIKLKEYNMLDVIEEGKDDLFDNFHEEEKKYGDEVTVN